MSFAVCGMLSPLAVKSQFLQPDAIYSFTQPVGRTSALIQGSDGLLYGVTSSGGSNGYGSAFRITTNGVLTTLVSFTVTNAFPYAALVEGSDGNFYGTTSGAGSGGGQGTVFRMTPAGALTTLYAFTDGDGDPRGALVQGSYGKYYGTTAGWYDQGSVFTITTNGDLTTLVSFTGANGSSPFAGLVQAANGDFYGTTVLGGSNGMGTVFKMTPSGMITTLVSFTNTGRVYSGLALGSDGNLYGTTTGFSNSPLSVFPGTVFRMTPEGALTTLAQFDYGIYPRTLAAASDGNLYGTTQYGGSSGRGEAFQVTTNGGFAVLYSFRCDSVGQYPSDLMQASSRLLFGSTSVCGTNGDGTVFRASVFAPPPILLSNPVLNGTQFSFEWNAITGKVYSVEWGSNLTAWFNLNSFVVATGSTMRITSPAFDPQRFFRVGLHP